MLSHRRPALLIVILAGIMLAWNTTSADRSEHGPDVAAAEPNLIVGMTMSGESMVGPGLSTSTTRTAAVLPGEAVPGELIVGFSPEVSGATREAAVAGAGAKVVRHLGLAGYSLVGVPAGHEREFTDRLIATPGIATAEPNLIRRAAFDPNDDFYSFQWHFTKIGMPAAWDKSTGTGVTVAVIDTGVAYETCAAATCGTDYFQAPDFGTTTFVSPFDFVHGDTHPNDENGHGTHVASTIGESTDNTTGVAGVAFNASIMPVQILDETGSGSVADEIDGIGWAVSNGADIINMSLGGPGAIAAEEAAVDNAVANGVVVFAAAGNGGGDGIGDPTLDCPACYPGSISVGATRIDQQRAPYSNYGTGESAHTLDLVAPGGDTLVDQNGDTLADGVVQQTFEHACLGGPIDLSAFGYCFFQGTSMATPHAAGVAALVLSLDPTLTPLEVRNILTGTATDLGPAGYDLEYGNGELNAAAAVVAAQAGSTDTDGDGCADLLEIGSDPTLGGDRDPNYFWDFMDVWTGAPPARDQTVTIGDIGAVVARFGAFQSPPPSKSEALAEATTSPPPAPAYHASFDRGGADPMANPWNLFPPDGSVTVSDIGAAVTQFGHSCS